MINNYLLASRGSSCSEYQGDLLLLITQIYEVLSTLTGVIDTNKPKLIIVSSKHKSAEYIKIGSFTYIIFDKSLLDELINWTLVYYGKNKYDVDQTELVKYLGLRFIAEEHFLRDEIKEAHSLASMSHYLFEDIKPTKSKGNELMPSIIVSCAFILAHELSHWITTEHKQVPDATISLQEDLLQSVKFPSDTNQLKKSYNKRYANIKDDTIDENNIQDVFNNINSISNDIVSSGRKEDEDVRCDMLAFIATVHLCSKFNISYQEVTNNIFILFRNLRVFEYLRNIPKNNFLENNDFIYQTSVPRLQARHMTLRQFWLIDGKDKGYLNDEISEISDQYDQIIDYLILSAYPIASKKILNDSRVIIDTELLYKQLSEIEFKSKTEEYLSVFWENIFK